MWVQSLGQEDPLGEEVATCSRYSCLENSMDRGAWPAIVHGVPKSPKPVSTWRGGRSQEGGDTRVFIAGSRCCAAESNATL